MQFDQFTQVFRFFSDPISSFRFKAIVETFYISISLKNNHRNTFEHSNEHNREDNNEDFH